MSAVESFEIPGWHGELRTAYRPADLAAAVARLADPGAARETVHWGRNYLYSVDLETTSGPIEVVVKQFRNRGWRARWRRRVEGSKAEKSWRVARYLSEHGVPTPEPLLLVESDDPEGPSLFVSRRIRDGFESRYFFRALNAGLEGERFPEVDVDELLRSLGATLRRMHEAGVWHRDVSVGNLLLSHPDGGRLEVYVVDLNRARVGQPLGIERRTRDLCRLRIFEGAHQDTFLRAYWHGREAGFGFKRGLYRLYHRGFLIRNRLKAWLRSPLSGLAPRRAYAHIPAPPVAAGARDRVAWDHLSDQPHQHAGRLRRLGVRLADAGAHGREMAACVAALPRIAASYRRLSRRRPPAPLPFTGLGVALRPWPSAPGELLAAVEGLGVEHVLLRLHPWAADHDDEEALARELRDRGYELAFTLPQNRDLVRDPGRWRAALGELARRFAPLGSSFQIGQAVNRSKWGVWRYDEYETLVAGAREAFAPYPEVRLLGPSVIDFEYYATAALLNMRWREGLALDGVASLLYVDRRGAPENRQLGLDTVGKVTLLKAIAETARNSGAASWITEVNWPLREGPHSPAGRRVSVDEESQASYLVRYYLLALCTGLVERVYWWQLVARGYGLMAPDAGGLVPRPAYRALSTLAAQLTGGEFRGALAAPPGAFLYDFGDREGRRRIVGWSADGPRQADLPAAPLAVWSRDGAREEPRGPRVELTGAPRYFAVD
ncbi:MAG: lipopolysaccharide kinase InaA family protein [Acidobacteriota bacterium]|nr:lipopolysaccharide kinase InaA family protein [Acidobacteriota bacterium]MDH3522302.1 lipopolysaccharide kinase InaA family protein [Acidobacteriota bacterium]